MSKMFIPDIELFTPKEAAKQLRVPYITLLQYMKQGKLKCYKLSSKKRLISREHMMAFLKSQEE